MNSWIDFSVTVPGASHIQKGKPCQDCSGRLNTGDAAIAAVADGHGDVRYFRSAEGARFAAEAAIESLQEFVGCETALGFGEKPEAEQLQLIKQLEKSIIVRWNGKVKGNIEARPFIEEELSALSQSRRRCYESGEFLETADAYGTTLVAVVLTDTYGFGLQIGDGDATIGYSDGSYDSIPKDESLIANITTSLCEEDAFDKFHERIFTGKPAYAIVTTDGMLNSFRTEAIYRAKIRQFAQAFAADDYETTQKFLEAYMRTITKDGSGDDLSIAGIIRKDGLEALPVAVETTCEIGAEPHLIEE